MPNFEPQCAAKLPAHGSTVHVPKRRRKPHIIYEFTARTEDLQRCNLFI